jgi:cytochrome c-type biogenesis protein CcmF
MGGYTYRFDGVRLRDGPNFHATEGIVSVFRQDEQVASLHPQKRTYFVQTNPMTEAGIDGGVFRDLYVALGEPLGAGAWSLRLHYKPLVRWIWFGALMMAGGGILAATDRRYRRLVLREAEARRLESADTLAEVPG